MSRRRTQKGAGFLNRIRGLFRTRKVAPAPIPQGRRLNLKNETYDDALKRNYVFFHHKLQGQDPPKTQRFVTPQQEQDVKRILLEADRKGKSADEIIQEIFGADPSRFQEEFSAWEEYLPEKYLNRGTPYERLAFPVSKSVARFIATIKNPRKDIRYTSNFQVHQCEVGERDQPVQGLTDDYCFSLIHPGNRADFEQEKGVIYPVSYILVKPEFFPRGTIAGGPIAMSAKRLPVISFVLDAFQQNGVLEIEPTLKATLEREAPELLSFGSQQPIVLVIPFYLQDPSVTQGQFLVVDPSVLARGRNVVNQKDLRTSSIIQDAFAKQKVYFMDPKTMFEIRDKIPQLWLANFGSFNLNVFKTLSPQEKLAFCVLQYVKFQEVYSLNRQALPTNDESATARKTIKAVEEAKRQVFSKNYTAGANPYELAENFGVDDTENLRLLTKIQEELFGTATVRTPEDVRRLLSKFDTRRAVTTGPVVVNYFGPSPINLGKNVRTLATASRKQRVKQMMSPGNVQQQRNNIVRRYKEALKMPVKTSRLPNFLRSKTAKLANKKRYFNRLQGVTNELRTFNERHGLLTKSGYGYDF